MKKVWLLGLGCLLTGMGAQAASLSDCDGPAAAVLASDTKTLPAQAYWLDRARLQWPGMKAQTGTRFALYLASHGSLQAQAGQAVRGADLRLALTEDSAALPVAFKFIGEGPRLRLQAKPSPELLRGELLLVAEDAQGRVIAATRTQTPGALDDWFAADTKAELGAHPGAKSTAIALWAPTARSVGLCRYADSHSPARSLTAMKRKPGSGVWNTAVTGNLDGSYYRYLVEVFVPRTGWVRNLVTDPYSVSLSADSLRSYVARLDPYEGARPPAKANTDLVVYELHARDFSIGDATVPAEHRGKYLAFTDSASQGMQRLKELARAGITDVHLLPVFDIASIPERGCKTPAVPAAAPDSEAQQAAVMQVAAEDCFNWGYDPQHYGAPEGSYSSNADDGAVRVREFRAMVQGLHAAGLRVGMDVVYNHTSHAGQNPKSVLDRIVPGYYQRLNAQGEVEHSTCCDNTATEHRMMAKLMIDTAVRWVRDFGIDSLRFDLMAHQPREAMEALQVAVDKARGGHVNLIGEGWNFGEIANGARFKQASQLSLNGSGIGTFSDRGRDAVRGGSAGDSGQAMIDHKGFINGAVDPATTDMVRVGLAGSLRGFQLSGKRLDAIAYGDQPAGYATEPGEVVNYVENHDNQTLFDINLYKLPQALPMAERVRVQMLAAAVVAFSPGVAYFHAGIEGLRSKSLDRNSFDSGDWFNRLDWSDRDNGFAAGLPPAQDNGKDWPLMRALLADASLKPTPADIAQSRAMFLDLLRLRASTPLLHLGSAREIEQRLHFVNTNDARLIAAEIDGAGLAGAKFKRVVYAINAADTTLDFGAADAAGQAFALHPIHLTGADGRPREQARFDRATGRFSVPPRTALVWVLE
ncbi:alpha-1,6-glucosidase domain-containing protein [Burkholderiaceae bacterium UC74_6]